MIYGAYSETFIEIGPLEIRWYAVLILTGALIALYLAILEGKKLGVSKDYLEDLVLFGIPIAVVGARIFYVLSEWHKYQNNLKGIFLINEGGLAIYGAVIAALIWGYFLSKRRGVNFLKAIDLAAVGFLFAQAMGRWGNFMNQEAHGEMIPGTVEEQRQFLENSGLPNFIIKQMQIGGFYYYPTFFYESIWNILGMIFILILRRTKYMYVGDLGLIYLMWYGFGRFFIEGMRTDSLYIWFTDIRLNQFLSVVFFVGGAIVLFLRHYKKQWYPKYYYELIEENK